MTGQRNTRWKPGQSGNPSGRTPGSGKLAKLRASLADDVPGILAKMVEQARAGDVPAARLLLERVLPPIRAVDQAVAISLPTGSLVDQGRAVLAAAGAGELTPIQAGHRAIWTAVMGLAAKHQAIDPITVFERLQAAGKADEVGGLPYLTALAHCVPSATHIRRYAEIVRDKALGRAVIAAADQALSIAQGPGEPAAKLDKAASLFAAIARPSASSSPRRLSELMTARLDHFEALGKGDTVSGISTGLGHMDHALAGGLKPGKVIVLAARPSVGKTSCGQQIGLFVAKAGHPVLMLSQEMPAGELVDRVVANLGGVNLEHLSTGRFAKDDWGLISSAADLASGLPFFVDDQPALTLLDIRAKARQVHRKEGLALLIVDYLQLCANSGNSDKRHHQIEQISRGLKQLAKELGICVLALSQLNRQSTHREDGEPELSDLKESGAIEEDADVVILLHPMERLPHDELLVLAKVAKNRGGRRGRLALAFHGKTQRWAQSDASVSRRKDTYAPRA